MLVLEWWACLRALDCAASFVIVSLGAVHLLDASRVCALERRKHSSQSTYLTEVMSVLSCLAFFKAFSLARHRVLAGFPTVKRAGFPSNTSHVPPTVSTPPSFPYTLARATSISGREGKTDSAGKAGDSCKRKAAGDKNNRRSLSEGETPIKPAHLAHTNSHRGQNPIQPRRLRAGASLADTFAGLALGTTQLPLVDHFAFLLVCTEGEDQVLHG